MRARADNQRHVFERGGPSFGMNHLWHGNPERRAIHILAAVSGLTAYMLYELAHSLKSISVILSPASVILFSELVSSSVEQHEEEGTQHEDVSACEADSADDAQQDVTSSPLPLSL